MLGASRVRWRRACCAEVLGVHRTYMGGVERGERNLTLKSLEKMAVQIGVEALTLLQR